eukprot:SAG11_NODE_17520_length_516_cov_0.714628_2_plen_45_part_00
MTRLQQVVQRRQHVALGALDPVQQQQPPVQRGADGGLIDEDRVT